MECPRCGHNDDDLSVFAPCQPNKYSVPECCGFVFEGVRCIEDYGHRGPHTWAKETS